MSKNTELLGVKVKAETKHNISELIEKAKAAGMIELNGDIFDLFVERFNQDELSSKMEYGADLKELNQITRRINEIFVHLAQRNETNLEDVRNQHESKAEQLKEELMEVRGKNKEVSDQLTEKINYINELTKLLKVNQDRAEELEKVQQSYIERIEEQKFIIEEKEEKISVKNELISQKEEAISAMKEDIAENNELKKEIDSLKGSINELQQTIASKEEELKKQKENLEFECQKQVFAREQELNNEKSQEIKAVQEQLAKELSRSQEKYEKILEEKDKLMNTNYELKITLDRDRSDKEKKEAVIASHEQEIAELKERIRTLES